MIDILLTMYVLVCQWKFSILSQSLIAILLLHDCVKRILFDHLWESSLFFGGESYCEKYQSWFLENLCTQLIKIFCFFKAAALYLLKNDVFFFLKISLTLPFFSAMLDLIWTSWTRNANLWHCIGNQYCLLFDCFLIASITKQPDHHKMQTFY